MTKRRQFGKIRRLPSGRWQARYRDDSGQEVAASYTFATKAEAGRFLARVQADMDRGEWRDPRLNRVTFGQWTADYLASTRHKRETTKARDETVLRKHFMPALGSKPLFAITPLDVRRTVDAMAETLAPATVRTTPC